MSMTSDNEADQRCLSSPLYNNELDITRNHAYRRYFLFLMHGRTRRAIFKVKYQSKYTQLKATVYEERN